MQGNDPTGTGGNTPAGQTPQGAPPPPTPPAGQTPPTVPGQTTPLDQLPADIQDYIKRLRKEAKTANDALDNVEKAKQDAEAKRLKEQGQFKELAEQHAAKIRELEPVVARLQALAELVNTQIEAQIKDWPAEVKVFDPGKDAPIEERQAWVNKSLPLIAKMAQASQNGGQPIYPGGNTPGPKPAGKGSQSGDVDELRRRYQESGKYAF